MSEDNSWVDLGNEVKKAKIADALTVSRKIPQTPDLQNPESDASLPQGVQWHPPLELPPAGLPPYVTQEDLDRQQRAAAGLLGGGRFGKETGTQMYWREALLQKEMPAALEGTVPTYLYPWPVEQQDRTLDQPNVLPDLPADPMNVVPKVEDPRITKYREDFV